MNSNMIHLLEKNIDKVDWNYLSANPSIFQLDYDLIREKRKGMAEEIAKIVWHPSRIYKWPEDQLIYDSDDFLDYEYYKNTSTIRSIKMSIKLRS